MGFDYVHEVELYRQLIKKLNALGFQFEDSSKQRGHSDLIDAIGYWNYIPLPTIEPRNELT